MIFSKQDEMVVVCGGDNHYAQHMSVMLASLILNCSKPDSLTLYIFDGGFGNTLRQKIEKVVYKTGKGRVALNWIDPDLAILDGLRVVGHVSKSAFLRLLIPQFLPDETKKAIYLDCDIIVERCCSELWNIEVDGYSHGAVQDLAVPYVSDPRGVRLYKERGFDPLLPYFNSGVLLINLCWWRKHDVAKDVFQYVRNRGDSMVFNDQDALNYILGENWKFLDHRWNVPPKVSTYASWPDTAFKRSLRDEINQLQQDPYIIHYIGRDKPWVYGASVPWTDRYFYYLRQSGWFENNLERVSWRFHVWKVHVAKQLYTKVRQWRRGVHRRLVAFRKETVESTR